MRRLFLGAAFLALAACNNEAPKTEAAKTEATATATAPVEITDARIRVAPNGKDVTAAYMTIHNNSDKAVKIIGASADFADHAELHTHTMTSDGMMSMKQVQSFDAPAKGVLELAPMGNHIMIFGVKTGSKEGDEGTITLKTEGGSDLIVKAKFVNNPEMKMEGDHSAMKMEGHNH